MIAEVVSISKTSRVIHCMKHGSEKAVAELGSAFVDTE